MMVRVKLFAAARQIVGADELEIELPVGGTVADLRKAMASQVPDLSSLTNHAMFAIDTDYADTLMHVSGHLLRDNVARQVRSFRTVRYLTPNGRVASGDGEE